MKRKNWRLMGCAGLAVFLAVSPLWAGYALSLGSGEGRDGQIALSLTTSDPVEGFVASVKFDGAKIQVTHVDRENNLGANLGAELVVTEIYTNGFTIGVVMDVDEPFEGQTIPAGTTELAKIDVRSICPADGEPVALEFVDNEFGNPPLLNLVVVGGTSIGRDEGLKLENGSWTPQCEKQRLIVSAPASDVPSNQVAAVRILVDNTAPVEGFVIALAHENTAKLENITLDSTATEAAGAEFVQSEIYDDGGTLGVILDFDSPFEGQTISVGASPAHIANFLYTYAGSDIPQGQQAQTALTLEDNRFGDPKLENLLVQGGLSVRGDALEKVNDSITWISPGKAEIDFWVNTDGVTITEGGCAEVGYFYSSRKDPIQGISIASCYDKRLTVGDINLEGSITAAVNAEFVNHHAENGELIIGILVDSTPPVSIDRMFPPTGDDPEDRLLLARIEFCDSGNQLKCGECLPIEFCDGATGAGSVPINNRAAVFHQSVGPNLHAGELCVIGSAKFRRGDCNFDGEVDIADPPSILGHVFTHVFFPPCLDACDANDDGVVDLADSVRVLRWLFKFGPEPPDPGPFTPGSDPTPDIFGTDLGCEAGTSCN